MVTWATKTTPSLKYDGSYKRPDIKVNNGNKQLKAGFDYAVTYANNLNCGTAKVVVTGRGKYTGTVEKEFSIQKASISPATVSGLTSKTYNGMAQVQYPKIIVGNKTLKINRDYSVTYSNNTNAGIATLTIRGKGNYDGTKKSTFTIQPRTIAKGVLVYKTPSNADYDGKPKAIPSAKIYWNIDSTSVLIANLDTDFKASYKSNINAGVATVTFEGKGNYNGKRTVTFTIKPYNFSWVPQLDGCIYTGKYLTPWSKISFTHPVTKKTYKIGTGLSVNYKNNLNAGMASATLRVNDQNITVNGLKEYTRTFRIKGAQISKASVTGVSNKKYSGKAITQNLTVKYGGKILRKDTDYQVSYRNNIQKGTAKILISGKGNYAGTKTVTFQIQ